MADNTISIFIDHMRVNLRIGLRDHERAAPQPVEVSAELFCDARSYLNENKHNGAYLDYDALARFIQGWEARPHVDLLETYMQELLDFSFSFPSVQAVDLRLAKLSIYPNAAGAGVSITIDRLAYRSK